MNIRPGLYDNMKDLYNKNPDFKRAFDGDKGGNRAVNQLESYMDDYGDDRDLVEGVLCDVIGYDSEYKWKISRHIEWRDKTIRIYVK